MIIRPFGAAREVTGSCYYLETKKSKVLIDCGMFQGTNLAHSKNFEPFGFDVEKLDAVLLTHAHLDHTGRLPMLAKQGFKGTIYATPPTVGLTRLVLEDAEDIMDEQLRTSYIPKLYDKIDVDHIMRRFKTVDDHSALCLKDLKIEFHNAGHIFGSAFLEIEDSTGKRVVFSGDLGNEKTPILKPKDNLVDCDALFIESTYGNRIHEDDSQRKKMLKSVLQETIKNKGVLLIPAFAIERTQELLYELNHLVENRLIPHAPIYLDSPMAIKATTVFDEYPEYYSKEAMHLITSGDELFDFPGLEKTLTRDESKVINQTKRPKIIIAGAGMMNGGRILHHLVRYLSDRKSTLLIIGFQARGTLGQKLYSGEKRVHVLSEDIEVRAKVASIGAYSAHADQKMLLNWFTSGPSLPKRTYCMHGEEATAAALATRITDETGARTDVPRFGEEIKV